MNLFELIRTNQEERFLEEFSRLSPTDRKMRQTEINEAGRTLLHEAALIGNLVIMRKLLEYNADPSAADTNHKTPLDLATTAEHAEAAALLRSRMRWQAGCFFNTTRIVAQLEEAFRTVDRARGQELVLLLGYTGSGKSAFLNYLLGVSYELIERPGGRRPLIRKRADCAVEELCRVGTGVESETLYPQVIPYPRGRFSYCDLGGFGENRGPEATVCTVSSAQILVSIASRIRAILLTIDGTLIHDRSREGSFRRSLEKLKSVFGSRMREDSGSDEVVYFIFTKTERLTKEVLQEEHIKPLLEFLDSRSKMDDFTAEEDDLLFMLELMHAHPERILIPNIFDRGETREQVFGLISRSTPHPTSEFDFMGYDAEQQKFNEACLNMAKHVAAQIERRDAVLPREIEQKRQELATLHLEIEAFAQDVEAKKKAKEATSFDPRFYESNISELERKLKECRAKQAAQLDRLHVAEGAKARLLDEIRKLSSDETLVEHPMPGGGFKADAEMQTVRRPA